MSVTGKNAAGANGVTVRILNPDDAEAVHALHREVLHALPNSSFMYRHNLDYFLEVIERRGFVIGAYISGSIVGYAAFLRPGEQASGRGQHLTRLGLTQDDVAESAGAAVHPNHRKQELFRQLIHERFRLAGEFGYTFMTTVVSPQNLVSLKVLLQTESTIVANHRDADGDNYLMLKSLRQELPSSQDRLCLVELGDTDSHLRHLETHTELGLPHVVDNRLAVNYASLKKLCLPWLAHPVPSAGPTHSSSLVGERPVESGAGTSKHSLKQDPA